MNAVKISSEKKLCFSAQYLIKWHNLCRERLTWYVNHTKALYTKFFYAHTLRKINFCFIQMQHRFLQCCVFLFPVRLTSITNLYQLH